MNLQNIYDNSLARCGKRVKGKNGLVVNIDGSGLNKTMYVPYTGRRIKATAGLSRKDIDEDKMYIDGNGNVVSGEYILNLNDYDISSYKEYNRDTAMPVRKGNSKSTSIGDIEDFINPYFEGESDIPGYINAGVNAINSIGTSLITNNALRHQKPPVMPMPKIAQKYKTNWNINADLDANREAAESIIKDTKKNTASSHVARSLINNALFQRALADSKLYQDQENKVTELINRDRDHKERIINENIEAGNEYRQSVVDFNNQLGLAKATNWSNLSNGLTSAIGQGITNYGSTKRRKLAAIIQALPLYETLIKSS